MILNTSGVVRDSDLKFYFDPAIDGSKWNGTAWYDLSENGFVGEAADGTPEIVDEFGGVLRTDGLTDQLKVMENITTNLNTPITIFLFAKYASLTNGNGKPTQEIVFFGKHTPVGQQTILGRKNSKHYAWGGRPSWEVADSEDPVVDRWYCYAYTYDGSTHKLYIDGELSGSSTSAAGDTTETNILLSGWRTPTSAMNNNKENFQGDMGPLLIYNRNLSAGEINQNFDAFRGRYGI